MKLPFLPSVRLMSNGKISAAFPTLFCPNGLNDVLQNFLIGQWTKNGTCVKKLSEGVTACMFHLSLRRFVAAIMKLKARAGIIFPNCEKSNVMMGTPSLTRTGDKSAIQNK